MDKNEQAIVILWFFVIFLLIGNLIKMIILTSHKKRIEKLENEFSKNMFPVRTGSLKASITTARIKHADKPKIAAEPEMIEPDKPEPLISLDNILARYDTGRSVPANEPDIEK